MDVTNRPASNLLTVGEVSRILNISSDRVRQLERSRVLTAIRTETGVRIFERTTIEEYQRYRDLNRLKGRSSDERRLRGNQ